MYVRGVNDSQEYKREENSFFRGIVVKNDDPEKMFRVKIFIPELSNQPLENWLQQHDNINFRFPGQNNEKDNWSDTDIYEEIAKLLPWAEPCVPLIGESGPGRYNSVLKQAAITDSNYTDQFTADAPTSKTGSFSPAFLWEHYDTMQADAFSDPQTNFTTTNNPFCYANRPAKFSNKPKGMFSVPSVGSKVWVFHFRGDLMYPVYFGGCRDYREAIYIHNLDSSEASQDYPGIFENGTK